VTSFFLKTTDSEAKCQPGLRAWNASWRLHAVFHFWAFLGGTPFFMGASPVDFLSWPHSYVHFNRGEKVETGAILGVGGFARSVEDGRGTNVSRESWFGANEVSGDLVSSASSPF
jgi:hypothetical protein